MYGGNGAGVGNPLSHRQRGAPSTARITRPGALSGWQLSRDRELGPQMRNPSLFCLKEPRLPQHVSARTALWTQAPKFRLVDQRSTLAFEKTENVERLHIFLGPWQEPFSSNRFAKGFFLNFNFSLRAWGLRWFLPALSCFLLSLSVPLASSFCHSHQSDERGGILRHSNILGTDFDNPGKAPG